MRVHLFVSVWGSTNIYYLLFGEHVEFVKNKADIFYNI